ncbi:MAG: cyclic nucleotide-binding domain-containing protein [Bdellovibrionales bacterium]|nr:cyclic nucleotide-binding domain-containing protein [Bdellovibrionales bacterium]
MQNIKEIKRGESLFKEGEVAEKVYFVQSGRVSIFIERNGKKIEIDQAIGSQAVGELAVLGNVKQIYSAEAVVNTKVLEIPVALLKTMLDSAAPGLKLLVKSSLEGLKNARQKIRNYKMENDDTSPCPQMLIPKIFTIYPLLAAHLGKKNPDNCWVLSWQALKTYSTRMFLESPQRIQSGLELLKKLGYLELTTRINEDEEEELNDIIFKEIQTIEDFAEFYQYHLYKPGRSEAIYVDDIAFKIIKVLVGLSINAEVNHKGAAVLDYDEVLKQVKAKAHIEVKNTHWDLLEKKGLLVQRKQQGDKLQLLLDKDEFLKTAVFWAFISEIDQWNKKGYIDFSIKEEKQENAGPISCSSCGGEIQGQQKFCHHCGASLAAA